MTSELIPAATVIPLRDGDSGVEVLMLRKNSKLAFGGMWVFPGGRVDDDDWIDVDAGDDETAARRAAVREAREEADLVVDAGGMVPFSHWTPPDNSFAPKRFATWFFACRAPSGEAGDVSIDGGEIHDHAWVGPAQMLERRHAGEVELVPPTIVTLHDLAELAQGAGRTVATGGGVDDVLAAAAARAPFRYFTRFAKVDGGAVTMWAGDAGYDDGEPETPGARHRLWMVGERWRYERVGC